MLISLLILNLLLITYLLLFPLISAGIAQILHKKQILVTHLPKKLPMVSILVTCCNESDAVCAKAINLSNIEYPSKQIDIIFALDGSSQNLIKRLTPLIKPNMRIIHYPINQGKIHVINKTVPQCHGAIVLFTDVDATLDPDAIKEIVIALSSNKVGGVCGMHIIRNRGKDMHISKPQSFYWSMDYLMKKSENIMIGNISSCYGTIYAVKKYLIPVIPESVTDDAFLAMSVVRKNYEFKFQPAAKVFIDPPSKNPKDELLRRKRIVLRSLRGLWISRELFNIKKFGYYSISLFTYKVLRRMIPILLICAYIISIALALRSPLWFIFFLAHSLFYLTAWRAWYASPQIRHKTTWHKIEAMILYFCIGNIGTLMGIFAFLTGQKISTWKTHNN